MQKNKRRLSDMAIYPENIKPTKKKKKKKEKEDALWDLMCMNKFIAFKKMLLFDEQSKPVEEQDEMRIKYLTISINWLMKEYNEMVGK